MKYDKVPVNISSLRVMARPLEVEYDDDEVSRPASLAVFASKTMNFALAHKSRPEFGVALTEQLLEATSGGEGGKGSGMIDLKMKRRQFREVRKIALFFRDNLEETDLTFLSKIALYGTLSNHADMANFKRC